MRRIAGVFIAMLGLSWGSVARAERKQTGFELGLRTGYAVPFGKIDNRASEDMNKGIRAAIPLWLDLGGRVTPHVMLGGYFVYGLGLLGSTFETGCANIDCSTHDIRLGAQVQYHVLPGRAADPWLGMGFGYEWLDFNLSGGGQSGSIGARGFELLNLQTGLDLAPSEDLNLGIGPFVSFSLGQYSDKSCSGLLGLGCTGSISTTLHEWLTVGVRGTFVP